MKSSLAKKNKLLLTGVTGFLGKVVLVELLRRQQELSLSTIHVLIRPKNGVSSEERFHSEVVSSPCFSMLKEGWEKRVEMFAGDLTDDGCGLDDSTRTLLADRVTHVIHCAASIDFDLPISEAAAANITSSLNMLELARSLPRLQSMVSVSTAYVTTLSDLGSPIEEVLAPLPRSAESIYQSIIDGTALKSELLEETGHPNTYTLTKSIAEHLLVERRGEIPLTIVRPSMISASWRHPFPGWIDSYAGFAGIVRLIGEGHLRTFVARPSERSDVIPVDEVAARVIDSAFEPSPSGADQPYILHAVAGLKHSLRIDTCGKVITDFFTSHRVGNTPRVRYVSRSGPRLLISRMLPARARNSLWKFVDKIWRNTSAKRLREYLNYINQTYSYFSHNTFDFRSSKPLNHPSFDAREYIRTVCHGVYQNLLGVNDSEIIFAGRQYWEAGNDFRSVMRKPRASMAIRIAAYVVTKALRRCTDRVTFDMESFEVARTSVPEDNLLVIIPSHRSYMDFILCPYLFLMRPDLGITIPHIAAAEEFAHIPVIGRLLTKLQAFYVKRGVGRADKELVKQVNDLVERNHTLLFFIEGTRSRSRQFLKPHTGLLRSLQSTGKKCTILPVAITYDRVPEEKTFLGELRGGRKPKMRLRSLLAWSFRLFLGRVHLGRLHIACGQPILLDPSKEVRAVARQVMGQLQTHMATTSHHLRCFLKQNQIDGIDIQWLRQALRLRGGRVIDTSLRSEDAIDPTVERGMRYHWIHLFYPEAVAAFPNQPAIRHHVTLNGYAPRNRIDVNAGLQDPKVRKLLTTLFKPICRDYEIVAESLGEPIVLLNSLSAKSIIIRQPEAHLPTLEAAFEDLLHREIIVKTDESDGFVWGPRAEDIRDYRVLCRWSDTP
ncbi:MAG: SDR family oxidoreductase [Candidatus Marinimicrobia bacterium]|nr:SDR family oxidoreductase [Candidatus Neomarinimicrobiota bacterium]